MRFATGSFGTAAAAVTKTENVKEPGANGAIVSVASGEARHWPVLGFVWHMVIPIGRAFPLVEVETVMEEMPLVPALSASTANAPVPCVEKGTTTTPGLPAVAVSTVSAPLETILIVGVQVTGGTGSGGIQTPPEPGADWLPPVLRLKRPVTSSAGSSATSFAAIAVSTAAVTTPSG